MKITIEVTTQSWTNLLWSTICAVCAAYTWDDGGYWWATTFCVLASAFYLAISAPKIRISNASFDLEAQIGNPPNETTD